MNFIVKLGLGIYVLLVLMISGFSEASETDTHRFLTEKSKNDQSSLFKSVGVIDEFQGDLFFESEDTGDFFLISPQSHESFTNLLLPATININGFVLSSFSTVSSNSSFTSSNKPAVLYIVSFAEVLPPN